MRNSMQSIFETPTIQSMGDLENQGRMQRMLNDERFRQAMSQNPHGTGNQYPQQSQQQAPQGPMRSIVPEAPQNNFMNSLREQMMLRQFQDQIQDGQGGGQVPAYVQPKYQNQANPYTPRAMQLNSGDTNNLRQYMGVGR